MQLVPHTAPFSKCPITCQRSPSFPPVARAGPRQYGPKVKRLQGICKAATIPIPPTIYSRNKGSESALQQALEELLEKHGLDASAGGQAGARWWGLAQGWGTVGTAGGNSSGRGRVLDLGKVCKQGLVLLMLPLPAVPSAKHAATAAGSAALMLPRMHMHPHALGAHTGSHTQHPPRAAASALPK